MHSFMTSGSHSASRRRIDARARLAVVAALTLGSRSGLTQAPALADRSAQGTAVATGPLAQLAAARATAPANWKCLPAPSLRAGHRVDALVCDAHFVATSIRVAAMSGQLTGASTLCALRVAEGVERAVAYAAAGDSLGARAAEVTTCEGRLLVRDSLTYAPDVLLRACPGLVWSWADRGGADCRPGAAATSARTNGSDAGAAAPARPGDPTRQRARDGALARLARATAFYGEGAYDKAERAALDVARDAERDVAQMGPGGGDVAGYAFATAGAAAALQGRYDEGVERLRKGLSLAPTNGWAATQLAQTLLVLGRNAEAADAARDAVALDGTSFVAHRTLGIALARLGRTEPALAEFSFAIGLAPRDVGSRIERARALNAIGRHTDAADAARDALALRADDAFAFEELGRALAGAGDRAGAVEALKRAVALEPGAHSARERLDSLTRVPAAAAAPSAKP
ncbi:MAG: hypothetical protein NVS9B3_10670 [Gemmatimonadaceae bacterium]